MPSRSKAQFKFFKAMENNPDLAKQHGVSSDVAHEFTDGMSKQRWSKLKSKMKKD